MRDNQLFNRTRLNLTGFYAIVIAIRLGAEHRDVVEIRRTLEQRFHCADTGHAVADHHQLLLAKFLEHDLPFKFERYRAATRQVSRIDRIETGSFLGSPSVGC